MEKKRILFVSQEISPYLPKSDMSTTARRLPQGIQEAGKEVRVFMPKYGSINERRHQLHEVIRLSGMNLVVDDNDHPLIIKVASISQARLQVYFIDNEEYFKRKGNYSEDNGDDYSDNDERSMFFCRGVLETVKKLGWQPDVIHCHGWMTAPMGMYVKKMYNKDPHFMNSRVVYSMYDHTFNKDWDTRFAEKLKFDGFDKEMLSHFEKTDYASLMAGFLKYMDGVIVGSENVCDSLKDVFSKAECNKLAFLPEENQLKAINEFFDKVIEEEVVIS